MNKTTQIITFSIMALMSLSFMIYAFIKADEAEKAAYLSRQEAEQLRDEALVLQEAAQESAAEAKRQEVLSLDLREALEACKANK